MTRKNIFQWIAPFFTAILAIAIVWFMDDFKVDVHLWRFDDSIMSRRLKALTLIILVCYLFYVFSRIMIYRFIGKLLGYYKKRIVAEYGVVLIVTVALVSCASVFATYIINQATFTWVELIKNNTLIVPVLLIYYTIMRNNHIIRVYDQQRLQIEKLKRNQLETELKFLRAQYHPHFLFNALNTIYFQIEESNKRAKQSVVLLSDLLRYQLYDINKQVAIEREISFINSYISFQQLRMSNRLTIQIDIDESLDQQRIHPLIYQPLLENAFKYVGGAYQIRLSLQLENKVIVFKLENTIQDDYQQEKEQRKSIGIENLRRRLALLYPGRHSLTITKKEKYFHIELKIVPDEYEN